jgi:GDSL-like Lipase/Acylhydrolase family
VKWSTLGALVCLPIFGGLFGSCTSEPSAPPSGTGGASQGTGGTVTNPSSSGGATQTNGTGGAVGSGGSSLPGSGGGTGGRITSASGGTTSIGTGGTVATGTDAGTTTHTGVWKVMPFGDSVTGSTCYPQMLSKDLIAAGHTNFQFVGTVTNNRGDCGTGTPTVRTEGHGGYGVTFLPSTSTRPRCTKQAQGCGSYAELQTWAAEKPDIVLMHFATNDCWDGEGTPLILAAYLAVIEEFRKQNPNVILFVSKIIPLAPPGSPAAPGNVVTLNAAVTPAWATTNSTATSPIRIIDHWTGFNATTDTMDGVHPTPVGAQKMSTASVQALAAAAYF